MGSASLVVEIWLQESLDARWQDWFAGMTFSTPVQGATRMAGIISDRACLHGLLERIRDLNLRLVSVQVRELPAGPAEPPAMDAGL